jgi:hypothetical protein
LSEQRAAALAEIAFVWPIVLGDGTSVAKFFVTGTVKLRPLLLNRDHPVSNIASATL